MVTIKTESGWQGSQEYINYLGVIWIKNLGYSEKINEGRSVDMTLKALSDFYYGLYQFRSAMIFFIESTEGAPEAIKEQLKVITDITQGDELIVCKLNSDQIKTIRNALLEMQDELFRVAGKCKLLVGITTKKQYENLGEELDEENA